MSANQPDRSPGPEADPAAVTKAATQAATEVVTKAPPDGQVLLSREGPVAMVTFHRPHARNAMTWPMYAELARLCDVLDADSSVRVVVLRGAGQRAFVAGTDIAEFTEFTDAADGVAYERRLVAILDRLESLTVPTVAAVRGWATGGGMAIASSCDLRVCTPDSRFAVPIARTLGNCLSMATYWRLVHLLGASRTAQLLLLASELDAPTALACGYVARVATERSLDDEVRDVCERLLGHAPLTIAATRQALRRIRPADLPDGEDLVAACYGSQDFAEGVRAFLDKRPPHWQGR
ncbi:MAG TPA: enoyl-CoA hydratase/isomerase family protein [Mycobacteriales bacterium]|nr:enoyl-CoA hydratase/isomerase family protein [Mycobacteriales bacterium]